MFDLLTVEYVWERLQPMMDKVFIDCAFVSNKK